MNDPIPTRNILIAGGCVIFTGALVSFHIGRSSILADLSQQRAREISVAVFQECRDNFGKDAVGEDDWLRMNARCANVADLAKKEIYAAGVEAEDRVLQEAKEIAKKSKEKRR